jgi:hypothetical protein
VYFSGSLKKLEETKKFLESNENGNITYQNLWDMVKMVLRGKFIAMSVCINKTDLK